MKNHVWRPLFVALGIIVLILLVRKVLVPKDFGVQSGYMYGMYRKSNVDEWKKVKVKYKGSSTCGECHEKNFKDNQASPHRIINCENCHGPLLNHPEDPEKLSIDRNPQLCLRCHLKLNYKSSDRGHLKGINPETHNPGQACIKCHNPHKPNLETK